MQQTRNQVWVQIIINFYRNVKRETIPLPRKILVTALVWILDYLLISYKLNNINLNKLDKYN